jgi:DeoR family fructose operon transcriptional repressor
MENFHADIAFLGTNGVDTEIGFTTPDPDEAAVKRKMIANSKETIMIADSSKFGKSCASRFARITDVDRIVTDLGVDNKVIAKIETEGVEVVFA